TGEQHADADLQLLESLPPPRTLTGLYEEVPAQSGALRFWAAAGPKDRRLEITGARSCVVDREDRLRETRCEATVAARVAARLQLELRAGPLRALLSEPGARARTIAAGGASGSAAGSGAGAEWTPGQRLSLPVNGTLRTVVMKSPGVFEIQVD